MTGATNDSHAEIKPRSTTEISLDRGFAWLALIAATRCRRDLGMDCDRCGYSSPASHPKVWRRVHHYYHLEPGQGEFRCVSDDVWYVG